MGKWDTFCDCCLCILGTCGLCCLVLCVLFVVLPLIISVYLFAPPLVIMIMAFIPSFKQTGTWKFLESQDLYFRADDTPEADGHVEQPCFCCYKGEFKAFLICILLLIFFWIPGVCWAIGISIHGIVCLMK